MDVKYAQLEAYPKHVYKLEYHLQTIANIQSAYV